MKKATLACARAFFATPNSSSHVGARTSRGLIPSNCSAPTVSIPTSHLVAVSTELTVRAAFATHTGAFFGTTFPHLLLQCYRELAPSIIAPPSTQAASEEQKAEANKKAEPPKRSALTPARLGRKTPQTGVYIPRIYGFRVSQFAPSGPRMQWMRERPQSIAELEQDIA